jgi:hypothetical protein
MALRLFYANLDVKDVIKDPIDLLNKHNELKDIDIIANYTAFQSLRKEFNEK